MMNNENMLKRAAALSAADWDKTVLRAGEMMDAHKFGCSECLLLAFQEALGQDVLPPQTVAAASAFRGGLGGAGCLCGALAGAQVVLGVFFGYYGGADDEQNKEQAQNGRLLSKELHDRFRDKHKASCCRVLKKGLTTGSPQAKEKCAALVRTAAALTRDILAREAAKA